MRSFLRKSMFGAVTALAMLTFAAPAALSCEKHQGEQTVAPAPATAVVAVEGMTCDVCVHRLKSVLTKLPGVSSAVLDLDGASATIGYDPEQVQPEAFIAAIEKAGFKAKLAAPATKKTEKS